MSLSPNEIEQMYRRQGQIAVAQGDLRTELRAQLERLGEESTHAAEAIRLGHPHQALRLDAMARVTQILAELNALDREMDQIGVTLRLGGEIPTPPTNGQHKRQEGGQDD